MLSNNNHIIILSKRNHIILDVVRSLLGLRKLKGCWLLHETFRTCSFHFIQVWRAAHMRVLTYENAMNDEDGKRSFTFIL